MSLLDAPWWGRFVADLSARRLDALAGRMGESPERLVAALVAADPGGPAEAAPWWPEALRLRDELSIRAIARRFGCEPRRIRRALARQGLRAGGVELAGRGVPALRAARRDLGREPDHVVARGAGVSIEAVQGERRRLGIPAFRPGGAPVLSAEEEAWIRGPEQGKRVRVRPDVEALEVVRRPTRGREEDRTSGPGIARAPNGPSAARAAAGVAHASGLPGVARAPGAPGFSREPTARISRDARPVEPPRSKRAFFLDKGEPDEIDRLLRPAARQRDGRQRIVRGAGAEEPVVALASVPAAPLRVAPLPPVRPAAPPVPALPSIVPLGAFSPGSRLPAPRRVAPGASWWAHVPGEPQPRVIEAPDIVAAARMLEGRVPASVLPNVAIERAP